jgi:hypothetical protein
MRAGHVGWQCGCAGPHASLSSTVGWIHEFRGSNNQSTQGPPRDRSRVAGIAGLLLVHLLVATEQRGLLLSHRLIRLSSLLSNAGCHRHSAVRSEALEAFFLAAWSCVLWVSSNVEFLVYLCAGGRLCLKMILASNHCVQATPGYTPVFIVARVSGAPDTVRWATPQELSL